ncbi:MAG TPA: ABC transporter permease [Patescibacteria group bacterium]|nr:ABC transporter permease [Patescibacteria group bacterium]
MYHLQATGATAGRILQQLLHDKRTIALMFLAPTILMSLLAWVFSNNDRMFNSIAPALLGVFPFVIMFLITSITTLRERTGGTLERLMTMRISKADIIVGYALAFGIFGIVQSIITSSVAIYWLGMDVAGPQWFVIVVAIADTLLGVALGLLASAFARTEFQAVQFMPAFIFPQLIVCGLFVPLAQLPDVLNAVAYWLPLTYAVDALNGVVLNSDITGDMWRDIWVVGCFIVAALALASLTLKRRS